MNEEQNKYQLPKDWKWVKLGEVCYTTSGGTPSRREPKYYKGNIPWVKSGELDKGIITNTEEKISEKAIENSSAKIFPKGTLLIALYGATIGKLAFLGVDAATNQAVCGIYKNDAVDSALLYNYLFYKKQKLVQQGIGGAQPNISQTILKQLDIPLPPKLTQLAIVSKIEELFSELDKGIENLRLAQQQLKTYRQSVLKVAFEGKLSEVGFTKLENEQDVVKKEILQSINPVNSDSDKGELPEGWKWVKIEDVTISLDNKRKPINKDERKKRHGNIPYYGANGQVGWIDDYIFNEPLVCVVEDETFTGREIPFSYKITGKAWVNNHAHVLKPKANLNIDYLNYQLFYYPFLRLTTGTTGRKKLTKNALSNAQIKICPIKEQHAIVQAIESRLSVADKLEESITQSLQQAEALRQSILKKAFEGRLIQAEEVTVVRETAKIIPFERKVLAGKIIHLLHDDKYFGLTKFQKTLYIVENFIQVEYETNFIQERAGPYDKEFALAFRKEMQQKDWFSEEQKGSITKFVTGEKAGSLIKDHAKYFRSKGPKIVFVIRQLMDKSTHDAELIATLYAVWNNRLIKKQVIKEKELVQDFFNWSPKKKEEFQEEEVITMYKWMKKVKLMPVGFGKVIEGDNR